MPPTWAKANQTTAAVFIITNARSASRADQLLERHSPVLEKLPSPMKRATASNSWVGAPDLLVQHCQSFTHTQIEVWNVCVARAFQENEVFSWRRWLQAGDVVLLRFPTWQTGFSAWLLWVKLTVIILHVIEPGSCVCMFKVNMISRLGLEHWANTCVGQAQ